MFIYKNKLYLSLTVLFILICISSCAKRITSATNVAFVESKTFEKEGATYFLSLPVDSIFSNCTDISRMDSTMLDELALEFVSKVDDHLFDRREILFGNVIGFMKTQDIGEPYMHTTLKYKVCYDRIGNAVAATFINSTNKKYPYKDAIKGMEGILGYKIRLDKNAACIECGFIEINIDRKSALKN